MVKPAAVSASDHVATGRQRIGAVDPGDGQRPDPAGAHPLGQRLGRRREGSGSGGEGEQRPAAAFGEEHRRAVDQHRQRTRPAGGPVPVRRPGRRPPVDPPGTLVAARRASRRASRRPGNGSAAGAELAPRCGPLGAPAPSCLGPPACRPRQGRAVRVGRVGGGQHDALRHRLLLAGPRRRRRAPGPPRRRRRTARHRGPRRSSRGGSGPSPPAPPAPGTPRRTRRPCPRPTTAPRVTMPCRSSSTSAAACVAHCRVGLRLRAPATTGPRRTAGHRARIPPARPTGRPRPPRGQQGQAGGTAHPGPRRGCPRPVRGAPTGQPGPQRGQRVAGDQTGEHQVPQGICDRGVVGRRFGAHRRPRLGRRPTVRRLAVGRDAAATASASGRKKYAPPPASTSRIARCSSPDGRSGRDGQRDGQRRRVGQVQGDPAVVAGAAMP